MLKSEMQHQFWITKKTVQRKLGTKEDEHIISSDAGLDAKIEVFKSIAETSASLNRILDLYLERLCILSQEECVFGRFLKEVGKRSKTTYTSITNTGKAVSYCGQQRMCVRLPLLRLEHEVDVFRSQAVRDTQCTIQSMEKERTEYRAALSWMKSASTELDPDTGRGLDKFRTAQSHVRIAKNNFDSLSMDSIQKIDLLAAARCNMYSHALVSYMSELQQFAKKTVYSFKNISALLTQRPKYDFCVLKDLTQEVAGDHVENIVAVDKDQLLFFADEFTDVTDEKSIPENPRQENTENILIELKQQVDDGIAHMDTFQQPEQESAKFWSLTLNQNQIQPLEIIVSDVSHTNDTNNSLQVSRGLAAKIDLDKNTMGVLEKSKKINAWMDIFADLDPLANPEAFDFKLNGGRNNFQET